jgi:hypothetical protein
MKVVHFLIKALVGLDFMASNVDEHALDKIESTIDGESNNFE